VADNEVPLDGGMFGDFLNVFGGAGVDPKDIKIRTSCESCRTELRLPFDLDKLLRTGKLTFRCRCQRRIVFTLHRSNERP
jgi:hypothetical protein